MARTKLQWNLAEAGNKGYISTKEHEATVKVGDAPKKGETDTRKVEKGTVTIVGKVVVFNEMRTWAEQVINKGEKDESKHTHLTPEFLLREFINENILINFKQSLRIKANPAKAVEQAITRLREKFPKLSDEQATAMAHMMLDSMV